MSRERKEYDVTVIKRDEVTTFPKLATPVVNVLVTYVAAGKAPSTVTILKDKYTLDLEKRMIREDLEKRLKEKAETYKV